ncbi:hypothetical protein DFH06DRAFT_1475349 [Mycena polygramma]|nr:hypothetical protein DFH06DRAFT_1475349 [Mycena polygramma]
MDVTGLERGSKVHARVSLLSAAGSHALSPKVHCARSRQFLHVARRRCNVETMYHLPASGVEKSRRQADGGLTCNSTAFVLSLVTEAPLRGAHSSDTMYRRPASGFTGPIKKAAGRHTTPVWFVCRKSAAKRHRVLRHYVSTSREQAFQYCEVPVSKIDLSASLQIPPSDLSALNFSAIQRIKFWISAPRDRRREHCSVLYCARSYSASGQFQKSISERPASDAAVISMLQALSTPMAPRLLLSYHHHPLLMTLLDAASLGLLTVIAFDLDLAFDLDPRPRPRPRPPAFDFDFDLAFAFDTTTLQHPSRRPRRPW